MRQRLGPSYALRKRLNRFSPILSDGWIRAFQVRHTQLIWDPPPAFLGAVRTIQINSDRFCLISPGTAGYDRNGWPACGWTRPMDQLFAPIVRGSFEDSYPAKTMKYS